MTLINNYPQSMNYINCPRQRLIIKNFEYSEKSYGPQTSAYSHTKIMVKIVECYKRVYGPQISAYSHTKMMVKMVDY
jgi:hypothetical protein